MTAPAQRIRIGLFTLAGVVLAAVVVVVFGDLTLPRARAHYYVEFDRTVYGLENGSDVYLLGIRVGNVGGIAIAPSNIGHVRVEIDVAASAPIRTNTRAVLLYAGITGLMEIDLRGGSLEAPPLPHGGTIPVGESELDRLASTFTDIGGDARQLLANANRVARNLIMLTDHAQLGATLARVRGAAASLTGAGAALQGAITENRAALRGSFSAMQHAATALDAGLGPVLAEFRRAIRSLDELVRELRSSPSRLLFSRPRPDRKLP